MILFIKHIEIEGPGTFGKFFETQGYAIQVIELHAGDRFPKDCNDVDAVISLGGPMNVYEEEKFSFLKEENDFIKRVVLKEIPFIGICLGSQLLAKACGAKIEKSPHKEIGFSTVQLTENGKQDPLFEGLKRDIEVFQWHEDMFDLPGAQTCQRTSHHLATSNDCPHQAFRAGSCAYGLQFHIEITDISIIEWNDSYIKKHAEAHAMKQQMLSDYQSRKESFHRTAEIIYNNFCKIIKNSETSFAKR